MEELKPCPHCGAAAHWYEIEAHQHSPALLALCPDLPAQAQASYVIEGRCGCGCGMIGDSLADVTARWNRRAEPQAEAVPPGFKLLKDSTHDERSWPEDYSHENGCYSNTCVNCLRNFTGYKRRAVCKVCDAAIAQQKGGV